MVTKGDQYDVREHSNEREVQYCLSLPLSPVCLHAHWVQQGLHILSINGLVSGRGLAHNFQACGQFENIVVNT